MLDSRDPLGSLKEHIAREIAEVASQLGLKVDPVEIPVQKTPSRDVGHLGSPIGFKLAGRLKMSPEEVSKSVVERLNLSSIPIAASASPARGFVNFRFDEPTLIRAIIDAASSPEFGRGDVRGGVVMVEHTSANPAHPLHVGSGRNAVIGDSYARMLRHAGRRVETHYLVNDSGNQTILMSYGFSKVTGEKPKGKIDHWFGAVYAATNIAVELRRAEGEERERLEGAIERLRAEHGEVVDKVLRAIQEDPDPEGGVRNLLAAYQAGETWAKEIVRAAVESVMEGFVDTLNRLGIKHDAYDWESDLIWNGWTAEMLERLKDSGYVGFEDGAAYVDVARAIREREDVARVFGLTAERVRELDAEGGLEEVVPPRFYLTRSDGTWLYTATDVAYSLYKIEGVGVEVCYNVIGAEQRLEQLQVRASVALAGEDPDRIQHFSYGMVNLVGVTMSGRLGIYVTLDELMDEAKRKVVELLRDRPGLSQEEIEEIAEKVAVGAIRFALISVDPSKPVVFSWDRVLNLEANSGPFIQYAYTRASGILRKAGGVPREYQAAALGTDGEYDLAMQLAEFPEMLRSAISLRRPDIVAQYANELAAKFNKFYETHPVLPAEEPTRSARLALVSAVKNTLGLAMDLIGVPKLEKM